MKRLVLIFILLVFGVAAPSGQQADPAVLTREGFALLDQSQLAEARKRFDAAIIAAREPANRPAEADALRGLGMVLYQLGRWKEAAEPLERAVTLYAETGDRLGEGRALEQLANANALLLRPSDELYQRAIAVFEAAGARIDQARTIRNRSHLQEVPFEARIPMLERAFVLAEGDARLQGLILHSIGSLEQTRGRLGASIGLFERAQSLLASGSPRERGRLLSSLGASIKMHGQPARAMEIYREALALFEQIGDIPGQYQALTYIAEVFVSGNQLQQALAMRERALELVKKTGSPGFIMMAQLTVGQSYLALRQYDKAVEYLEGTLSGMAPDIVTGSYHYLANAYAGAGRIEDAIRTATQGIERARAANRPGAEMFVLQARAQILEGLGRVDEALTDARAGLDALERMRAGLATFDYLKGGFADAYQSLFAQTITLLDKAGRTGEGVVVAEQARARAFLDLLASRSLESETAVPLTMRGPGSSVAVPIATASATSAPVPTAAAVHDAAKRLGSTIIAYWVGTDATFVWAVSPSGKVVSHRSPVSRPALQRLVRRTWSMSAGALAQRGVDEDAATMPTPAAPTLANADRALSYLTMRGGETMTPTGHEPEAYRELYDLLIAPVRGALPTSGEALITIVPHGPLFELSFAALSDPRGRYLIEDYRLHYAPSASMLEFTEQQVRPGSPSSRYLFVANPATSPGGATPRLVSLPGAEREVSAVSRIVGARRATTLTGRAATEGAIRESIGKFRVVHFATHGLVSSDNPLDSFLALASNSADRSGDGRLTAGEIYGLKLSADLVVLSACRAAGGRISGDGILGLTRALFSAGTPSIIAALWDMADESAEHLLPGFYAEWQKSNDKGQALRAAQLSMLRDLRARKLTVNTPFGSLPLPPHPALWANLVLIGEPH